MSKAKDWSTKTTIVASPFNIKTDRDKFHSLLIKLLLSTRELSDWWEKECPNNPEQEILATDPTNRILWD